MTAMREYRKACEPKERIFAEEYSIDVNLSRSCRVAGISNNKGAKLIATEHVALYIDTLMVEAGERRGITASRVRHELGTIAFMNILDYSTVDREGYIELDLTALTRDQAAAITEVQTSTGKHGIVTQKVKFGDKLGALRDLGKSLGMFIDRSEVGSPGEFKGHMPEDEALKTITDLKGKTGA